MAYLWWAVAFTGVIIQARLGYSHQQFWAGQEMPPRLEGSGILCARDSENALLIREPALRQRLAHFGLLCLASGCLNLCLQTAMMLPYLKGAAHHLQQSILHPHHLLEKGGPTPAPSGVVPGVSLHALLLGQVGPCLDGHQLRLHKVRFLACPCLHPLLHLCSATQCCSSRFLFICTPCIFFEQITNLSTSIVVRNLREGVRCSSQLSGTVGP